MQQPNSQQKKGRGGYSNDRGGSQQPSRGGNNQRGNQGSQRGGGSNQGPLGGGGNQGPRGGGGGGNQGPRGGGGNQGPGGRGGYQGPGDRGGNQGPGGMGYDNQRSGDMRGNQGTHGRGGSHGPQGRGSYQGQPFDMGGNQGPPYCRGGSQEPQGRGGYQNQGPPGRGGYQGPRGGGGNQGPHGMGGNQGPGGIGYGQGPQGRGYDNQRSGDMRGNQETHSRGGSHGPQGRGGYQNQGPPGRGGNQGPRGGGGNQGPHGMGGNQGPGGIGYGQGPQGRGGYQGPPGGMGQNQGPRGRGGNPGPRGRGGYQGPPGSMGGNEGYPHRTGGSQGPQGSGSYQESHGRGDIVGQSYDRRGNQGIYNRDCTQGSGLLPTPVFDNGPTGNIPPMHGSTYQPVSGSQPPVMVTHTVTMVGDPTMMTNNFPMPGFSYPNNLLRSNSIESLDSVGSNRGARPKQNNSRDRRDSGLNENRPGNASSIRGGRNTYDGSNRQDSVPNVSNIRGSNRGRVKSGRFRGRGRERGGFNRPRGRGRRGFDNRGLKDDSDDDDTQSVDSLQSWISDGDHRDELQKTEQNERKERFAEGHRGYAGNFSRRGGPNRQSFRTTRGRQGGRWRPIAQHNIKNKDDEDVESRSRTSSVLSNESTDSNVSNANIKSEQQKESINADGVNLLSTKILQSRVKRYKKRVSEMKKIDNADMDKMQNIEKVIAIIQGILEKRRNKQIKRQAKNQKKSEDKLKEKCGIESIDSSEDEEGSESDSSTLGSGSDSDAATKRRLAQVQKRMNTIRTKKGNISFRPVSTLKKTKKSLQAAAKMVKVVVDEKMDDVTYGAKDKARKIQNKSNTKVKEEIDSPDDVIEDFDTEEVPADKKSRNRKTNRGNKNKNLNKDDANADKEIGDLLEQFDDICKPLSRKEKNDTGSAGRKLEQKEKNARTPSESDDRQKKSSTKKTKGQKEGNEKKHVDVCKEPDVNEVFKFVVKNLNGKGTPEDIERESGLFPINFDICTWLRRFRTSRFTLIEKDGQIILVMVYNKDVTYCLDYITGRSCTNTNCLRYHICKDLLCGHCRFGDRCKKSHDLLNESNGNLKKSKVLGYSNVFTSDEICSILMVRFPHICSSWNETGSCSNSDSCMNLHYCPRYNQNKCLEGAECPLVHDKLSDHNKLIVNAFGMGNWNDKLFGRIIYIKRTVVIEPKAHGEDQSDPKRNRMPSGDDRELELMDIDEPVATSSARSIPTSRRNRIISYNADEVEDVGSAIPVANTDPSTVEPMVQPRRERKRKESGNSQSIAIIDSDNAVSICDLHLVGNCRKKKCTCIHSDQKLPYIWQVKLFEKWEILVGQEEIEKKFCDKKTDFCTAYVISESIPDPVNVVIEFDREIKAYIDSVEINARRLSTASFSNVKSEDDSCSFKTQWRWFWKDDLNRWISFEPDALQHTLEAKYLAGQHEYLYSRENYRFKYALDFTTMTQWNLDTEKARHVRRRPLLVLFNQVAIKEFSQCLERAPSVDVSLPESWLPWDLAHPFELVKLSSQSKTYRDVESNFYKTLDRNALEIDAIFRVQNHMLWSLFSNKEKSMIAASERNGNGSDVNKGQLFHGTDGLDAVRGISINNVDNRVSGKNATLYGDGAYFAMEAKYSHMYTGNNPAKRFVFQASVIVGQYTQGDKSYRRPPSKPGSTHELYDTCVNSMSRPTIFVVFDRNQYYPEFLIQYHDAGHGERGAFGSSNVNHSQKIPPSLYSSGMVGATRRSSSPPPPLRSPSPASVASHLSSSQITTLPQWSSASLPTKQPSPVRSPKKEGCLIS